MRIRCRVPEGLEELRLHLVDRGTHRCRISWHRHGLTPLGKQGRELEWCRSPGSISSSLIN